MLPPQLQIEILKQLCHPYLKKQISITQENDFTLVNLFKFYYINGTKTKKLYPSASLMRSDQDLEQRLEKKLNDVNSFHNS